MILRFRRYFKILVLRYIVVGQVDKKIDHECKNVDSFLYGLGNLMGLMNWLSIVFVIQHIDYSTRKVYF
jgi:hypothetical protein